MVEWITNKFKAIAASAGALATVLYMALADKSVDLNEGKNIVAAIGGLLTAFGITYFSPKNTPNKERFNG